MALITCQECGKEHSDTIESCPHCGYIRNAHEGKETTKSETAPKKEKLWVRNTPNNWSCSGCNLDDSF